MREPIECNIPPNPPISVPGTQVDLVDQDRPNTVSQNLFLYRLSNVWHTVKALKADRPLLKDYTVTQRLHNEVNNIMDLLPPTLRYENPDKSWDDEYPYLNQQREDILTKANLILMALHRPHMEHHVESHRAALQAAIVTLESQNRSFMGIGLHQYKLFGLSFYTIDASLLLSIVAAKHLPRENDEFMARIDYILQQVMNRLSVMYSYSPIARSGLAIVRQCYAVLKKRWQRIPAILNASTGMAIELENARQRLGADVATDSLSERRQLPPSRPTSGETISSQSVWTFDAGTMDAEFMPKAAINPSLCFGPSTTYFDETYWMNLINQTPDVPCFDLGAADEMGEIFDAADIAHDTVRNQTRVLYPIQFPPPVSLAEIEEAMGEDGPDKGGQYRMGTLLLSLARLLIQPLLFGLSR
ncbi:uncharacterized protein A1O9_01976 [Exophiala aquamarina CBS 119918]|uniref:Transcription factor domain-containing protein n=1 Tax=Exophiala aquamarina CBS 119918 TaxID=1182545 RepID=A0A072PXU1_9EURO|nr:uncharacterized protein A1O9_01976 [Exophiala aquamarina CBS 119918]KEF60415.1 hypothetical protein A1O9_01976 [Exophiala aquamarina CBS 119918]